MGKVVLVTGVSGNLASMFARSLIESAESLGIERVVGIDTVLPPRDIGAVKFVRADIRTPVIAKVMAVEEVDTVVHLVLNPSLRARAGAKELNVIGTMQLLAACQRSTTVEKFILGSSTAVYGTSPRDPAMFSESCSAINGVRTGFPKDVVEVEGYVRGFQRRRPDVLVTTIRTAQVLDAEIPTPMRSYLTTPVLPTAMGYDPRLQFTHRDDLLTIFAEAVRHDRPGTFNVAGDGVLMLSQIARRLGRPVIPLLPVGFNAAARQLMKRLGSDLSPDLHRLLMYGRVVDTSALRDIFGYDLSHTTGDTFEEFRRAIRPGMLSMVGGAR